MSLFLDFAGFLNENLRFSIIACSFLRVKETIREKAGRASTAIDSYRLKRETFKDGIFMEVSLKKAIITKD
jgi:hypothetical protein